MRICVYLKIEDLAEASHHDASKELADLILSAVMAKRVRQDAIQLTTDDSWKTTKDIFRKLKLATAGQSTQAVNTFWDGPFGIGNILPFAKTQNQLMSPERLHYEIPACGAHTRHISVKTTNAARPIPQEAELAVAI